MADPRGHILIVRNVGLDAEGVAQPDGVGTMLVSREPLSNPDVLTAERIAGEMGFEVVLTPTATIDPAFDKLAGPAPEQFLASHPLNITPPTDDSPFFFNMVRLRDIFNFSLYNQGVTSFNMRAVFVLGVLLAVVVFLTLVFIIGPLVLTTEKSTLRGALPISLFFGCIGLGFMFVEISQMQRLVIFLGHPTYGLSVVLFSLLLSSSLGSYLTQRLSRNDVRSLGRGAAAHADVARPARGLWTGDPLGPAELERGDNADSHCNSGFNPWDTGCVHGNAVPDRDGAGVAHGSGALAVALGNQRGHVGLRVGTCRGDRA